MCDDVLIYYHFPFRRFHLGSNSLRVAAMGYGSSPFTYFNFILHQTQSGLSIGFDAMTQWGGDPHIEAAASMLDGLFSWVSFCLILNLTP